MAKVFWQNLQLEWLSSPDGCAYARGHCDVHGSITMTVLSSQLNPRSAEFQAHAAAMQALVAGSAPPAAQALMDYLRGAEARGIMRGVGLEPCI